MMAMKLICIILNINFYINWNLELLVSEERGKIFQSKGLNQQQTQTTYGVEAGIWTCPQWWELNALTTVTPLLL